MIHLHVHSTFSFLDGAICVKSLLQRVRDCGQNAVAITDHGNIYAHRTLALEAPKYGVKPIYGCELYVRETPRYLHVTILAENLTGYENLCRLVTLANQDDHFDRRPQVTWREIHDRREGLIILSGCFGDGVLHRVRRPPQRRHAPRQDHEADVQGCLLHRDPAHRPRGSEVHADGR
jgi:DNA polymerase III alpha subunit